MSSSSISLPMAIIIGMNAIIGVGIFSVPVPLAITAGPAGLLTYAFVILAVMGMALSLARLTTLYPQGGAFYTYAASWGGHYTGMLATGLYLIGLVVAMGLMSQLAGSYLSTYIQLNPFILSIGVIALLVLLNLAGAVISQAGQLLLIVLTILPLAVISGLCLSKASLAHLRPFTPHGTSGIFHAIKVVIFGFFGFESIPALFKEIHNPKKNAPRAIIITILLVSLVYLVFSGSIILGLPTSLFTDPQLPLSHILSEAFPHLTWLADAIGWSIIITILGTLHSMIWSISRLVVDTCNKTIWLKNAFSQKSALVALAAGTTFTCLTLRNFDLLFNLVALCITAAFALSMISLIICKKDRTHYQISIALLGLATSIIIIAFAVQGTIHELTIGS